MGQRFGDHDASADRSSMCLPRLQSRLGKFFLTDELAENLCNACSRDADGTRELGPRGVLAVGECLLAFPCEDEAAPAVATPSAC